MFEAANGQREVTPSLAERRAAATRDAIVDAAWDLSRREGLTGWSLRQLARSIGIAAPTLYAYVDSKTAIYDLMFRQSYEELDATAARWTIDPDALRASFRRAMREWFAFCVAEPVRYQLMFQRTIPDFEPSPEAYTASLASYERFRAQFAEIGITAQSDLDLWTAIASGLVNQQISNDPGGDRWATLVDDAVDLICDRAGVPADPDPTHHEKDTS